MDNLNPLALFVLGFGGILALCLIAACSVPVENYIERKLQERRNKHRK